MSSFLYAKFLGDEVSGERGRLLFSVLNPFSIRNYQIALSKINAPDPSERIGQLTLALDNLSIDDAIPENTEDYYYLFDKEDRACAGKKWKKKIQVKFDIFSSYRFKKKPILMPYPIHPVHWGHHGKEMSAVLDRLRRNEKKTRIFFSGDTKGYKRPKTTYPDVKLSRPEIIRALIHNLPNSSSVIDDYSGLSALLHGEYINKFVVLDTSKLWVDDSVWFDYLSASDFFLSPPGICMPMCHNVIEAMALGVIPIINYPEWFSPTLEHMSNCIVFGSIEDLCAKVNEVLEMGEEDIAELKMRVISYYEKHLRPEAAVHKVEANLSRKVQLLMITERYVNQNFSKLGGGSILMR